MRETTNFEQERIKSSMMNDDQKKFPTKRNEKKNLACVVRIDIQWQRWDVATDELAVFIQNSSRFGRDPGCKASGIYQTIWRIWIEVERAKKKCIEKWHEKRKEQNPWHWMSRSWITSKIDVSIFCGVYGCDKSMDLFLARSLCVDLVWFSNCLIWII